MNLIQSHVNPAIYFRPDQTTLTIVNTGMHAQLIEEFVDSGDYKMLAADLVGNNSSHIGEVRERPIDPKKFTRRSQSKTWIVGLRELNKMRDNIGREEGKLDPVFFHDVGRYSIFVNTNVDFEVPITNELHHFKMENNNIFNKLCSIVEVTLDQNLPFGENATEEDVKRARISSNYSLAAPYVARLITPYLTRSVLSNFDPKVIFSHIEPNLTHVVLSMIDGDSPWKKTVFWQKNTNGTCQEGKKCKTSELVEDCLPGLWDEDMTFHLNGVKISSDNRIRSVIHLINSIRDAFLRNEINTRLLKAHNCSTWVIEKLQIADVPVKIPTWHFMGSDPQELVRENKEWNIRIHDFATLYRFCKRSQYRIQLTKLLTDHISNYLRNQNDKIIYIKQSENKNLENC